MKNKDFERLSKTYLLPHLQGFQCKRGLVFATPIHHLLRGFCFERSIDKAAFHGNVFIQPLYIPIEYVYFTFGRRLSGRISWWSISKDTEAEVMQDVLETIKSDGLPMVERFRHPVDLVIRIDEFGDGLATDPHKVEAVAYSLILDDQHDEAVSLLNRLREMCEVLDPMIEWPRDIMRRGNQILKLLKSHPNQALELLGQWRAHTLHQLKLQDFAASGAE